MTGLRPALTSASVIVLIAMLVPLGAQAVFQQPAQSDREQIVRNSQRLDTLEKQVGDHMMKQDSDRIGERIAILDAEAKYTRERLDELVWTTRVAIGGVLGLIVEAFRRYLFGRRGGRQPV